MPLTRLDLWSALLGACVLHWCSLATAEDGAAARLFDEGRALLVDGRFAEACPKLEASQRLEPRLGTLLNIAFCHEQQGELATAWRGFEEAVAVARREGDLERERFARGRAEALAARVPWLEVRVAAGALPSTILLDGAPLAPGEWGRELPVDPGSHTLVALHGGGEPGRGRGTIEQHGGAEYWQMTLVLRESEHAHATIPAAPASVVLGASSPARAAAASAALDASSPALAPETRAPTRFVYELGAFAGFVAVDTRRSTPDDGAASIQTVVDAQGDTPQLLSCAAALCEYPSIGATAGVVAGLTGFVGYAASAETALGARFLIGPRFGGGALVALGPSVSFPLSARLRLSPAVLFGTASHVRFDIVQLSTPTGFHGIGSRMNGALGFAMGLGAELGLTLIEGPSGSVVAQATPLYLYGSNGSAWSLPLGAAYHWN